MYCTFVRSQLEYCTVVWSSYTARNVNKLERIQWRATKFILKTDVEYDTRRERLNLLSLKDRCFLLDVLFFCEVLNGYINLDVSSYIQFYSDSDRFSLRGRDELVLKNYARTDTYKINLAFFELMGLLIHGMCYHFLFGKLQVSLALKGE